MIVDNTEILRKYLGGKDCFYYLQVIQRRKDNPDLPKDSRRLLSKFVTEKNFDLTMEVAKVLCTEFKARTYISLIPRDKKKFALGCIKEFANSYLIPDYPLQKVPDKVALQGDTRGDGWRYWIIDVDDMKDKDAILLWLGGKVKEVIPTLSGVHILSKTFNPSELRYDVNTGSYSLPGGEKFAIIEHCSTIVFAVR